MIICSKCEKVLDPNDTNNIKRELCLPCVLATTPGSLPIVDMKPKKKELKQIPTDMEVFIDKFDYRYMVIFRHTIKEGDLKGKFFEFGVSKDQLEDLLKQIAERKRIDGKNPS